MMKTISLLGLASPLFHFGPGSNENRFLFLFLLPGSRASLSGEALNGDALEFLLWPPAFMTGVR